MQTRKNWFRWMCAGFFVLAVNVVWAQDKDKDKPKPRVIVADIVETKAKVESVDQVKRLVTLTDNDGQTVIVKAGAAVKNLDQIKPGDTVKFKQYESTALFVRKSGEAASASETMAVAVAEKGKEGEAIAVETVEYKATVEAVHPVLRRVTLKGADGKKRSFRVHEDFKTLAELKKGDELVIRHTEAIAVSIEKAT